MMMQGSCFRTTGGAPRAARSCRPMVKASTRARVVVHAYTEVETASMKKLVAEFPLHKQPEQLVTLLSQAGHSKSVDPEVVEGALCALEKIAADSGSQQNLVPVDGRWRLVFSTATKLRFFQYIPVIEDLDIQVGAKRISLESELGPFRFLIKGAINSWDESSGKMDFQFNQVDTTLFGNKILEKALTPKPKTYTYFFLGPDVGAARSSAGGVSLLVKNP